jgi:anti-anti-sigma factor
VQAADLTVRMLRVGGDTVVLGLHGELDGHTAPHVAARLRNVTGVRIVIDLLAVRFLDSVGIAHVTHAGRGQRMSIVADDPRTLRVLRATDGARDIQVHRTLAAAIGR